MSCAPCGQPDIPACRYSVRGMTARPPRSHQECPAGHRWRALGIAAGAPALLLILATAAPVRSQGVSGAPASGPADPGQREFVEAYMAAVSASDAAALRRLLHPAVLACIDDKTREFFDSMLARDLRARPTAGYRITSVERPGPD